MTDVRLKAYEVFPVEYGGESQFTCCDEQVNLKAPSLDHILCYPCLPPPILVQR